METRFEERVEKIRFLAKIYGWQEIQANDDICLLGFRRSGVRLNVYYSKMTVSTAMKHPTRGKTQLFRKKVNQALLEKIMRYPRTHTSRGYYNKY